MISQKLVSLYQELFQHIILYNYYEPYFSGSGSPIEFVYSQITQFLSFLGTKMLKKCHILKI
jgi:hypothetical protein